MDKSRLRKPGGINPDKRRSMPQGVSSILASALRKNGIGRDLNRYQFVLHWNEIVGEEIARFAQPGRIEHDTLYITVATSQWAQELSFHKEIILEKLKPFVAGGPAVSKVVFTVGVDRKR
jgi:predicted nucleic acid-binding Zn ribbon protein